MLPKILSTPLPHRTSQVLWGVFSVAGTLALYYALTSYTAVLDNPTPMLYGLLLTHLMRVYFSVIHDMHRETMKEIGLLTLAALAGVMLASVVRPFVLDSLLQLEAEIGDELKDYREYLVAFHNKAIGIPGFFIASYAVSIKAIRWTGNRWSVLRYPRSSLELFGAFYKAAYDGLPPQTFLQLESDTRAMLSETKGIFTSPLSPNQLIPSDSQRHDRAVATQEDPT